ncbi:fucose isomerase [Brachybacterium sp. P6-10-X1]|uniref:fucose isomerase n=1 Tax=Brachybacterium sp. P6-10-X1 TaxID=1903186 RepID=UPI00097198E8|nr:fucose isomerase [Brachybacterium sp. P6-10-X1]APX34095.1 fucose isomerase [Brachybacterium sp. P6-10-X1]
MTTTAPYQMPTVRQAAPAPAKTVYLIPSGDLRESANVPAWPFQQELERIVADAVDATGWQVRRGFEPDQELGHGFIRSQRMGMEVFRHIPAEAPLIVATANWQYSHHVLAGLRTHRGPILTVANFAPEWPGLVGLLNLNGGLTKMDREYSTLWTVDGSDDFFRDGIATWVETGAITHDDSHVRPLPHLPGTAEVELGRALADQLLTDKAIIGVFDEGCMGMYNAIIDDEMLNPLGIYKERLSQSALWAEMQTVTDEEAEAIGAWLKDAGMTFRLGTDEATELTESQLRSQYAMYIAALRLSDDFGLDAVGVQYQQGLKDVTAASDLVEGLLNNVQRPPVTSRDGSRVLWEGKALPNFNEVDEGVAVDALVTNRIWTAMGMDPATTLHDVRWGEEFDGQYVWVYEISGSVPPSHFVRGYADAEGWRQGPEFFPAGGSTINGVSKPGEIVWSRVYVEGGGLHVDIGRGSVVELPDEEVARRKQSTNPEWPIANVVLHGVSRDQFMGRHKANHAQLVYADDAGAADRALTAKAALFHRLGVTVHLCGDAVIVED